MTRTATTVSTPWALGDYHRFAKELIWELGPVLVGACSIQPGQNVLDVASGSGNVAIRAADTGARVVASDLTPESLDAGRREAASRGVELEWVAADAQALPFADERFDAVVSCFGAIFAPDHRRVAQELLRVCRPGGTIGMANFRPQGTAAEFFGLFAPYLPPPPTGAEPPLLWGDEAHVRDLFSAGVEALQMTPRHYVERAATPRDYRDFVKATFGPVVAVYRDLANDPAATAELDRAFLDFAERRNTGRPGGPAEYRYDYLLVVARRR